LSVLLYRGNLALKSGAGRLMLMQAAGLERCGERVRIAGSRNRLKFWLASGRYPLRLSAVNVARRARSGEAFVVDHEASVPDAGIGFVHNLATALAAALPGEVSDREIGAEQEFFSALSPDVPIVANSELVRRGIVQHFSLAPERIVVHHPGYTESRFSPRARAQLRNSVRRAFGIDPDAPLTGLVTSGHFAKRGLGDFLATAEIIQRERPNARFLIVGSKQLPPDAARHPLVRSGVAVYRPKTARPEQAFAALDLLLYPAVYEEFGMVIAEAQAIGVPVVVTDRVGAAETLPDAYRTWGLPEPTPAAFAAKCLELIDDRALAERLAGAARDSIVNFASDRYAAATAATIVAQKRRLR